MSRRKRTAITVTVSVILTLAVTLGAVFGIERYNSRVEDIHFEVEDTLADGGGRRAHVILIAGQSNASGCANDIYLKKNVTPEKYAEYEAGYDNVYINYRTTNDWGSAGFVNASVRQGELGVAFGPELGLAEKLSHSDPDKLFFIIKYAIGASNLVEDWLSPSAWGKTGIYYSAFVGFVNSSIEYLLSKNYVVEIEGMCWVQGESDSVVERVAKLYKSNMTCFIRDIRREFDEYASPEGIVFVDAYIADLPQFWEYCELINRTKQEIADSSPINCVVDTVSAGLTTTLEPPENPDAVHYDSMAQILLGHLFAGQLLPFID